MTRRYLPLSAEELASMADLADRICSIVDESHGKITFAEMGRQCSCPGSKLGTYARNRKFSRAVYERALEWLLQFEAAFPHGITKTPVQLNLQAFGLDPELPFHDEGGTANADEGDRYAAIVDSESLSIY